MAHTNIWVCWGTDTPSSDARLPTCRLCGGEFTGHNASICVPEHKNDAEYIRRWGVGFGSHASGWWASGNAGPCAVCGLLWGSHNSWRCPGDLVLAQPTKSPPLPHAAECEDCDEDGALCADNDCVCDRCGCWFGHCRECDHVKEDDCPGSDCSCSSCGCFSHCGECGHILDDCGGGCTCCCNDHCGDCEHYSRDDCDDDDCRCDCCCIELDTTDATPDRDALEILNDGAVALDYEELFGPKDIIPVIAEFYLLSALSMDNPLAIPIFEAYSKKLSAWLLNQAVCACMGEARWAVRHVDWAESSLVRLSPLAQALIIAGEPFDSEWGRAHMWEVGYPLVQAIGFEKVFSACEEIFSQLTWAGHSFGGKSWSAIAAQCAEFARGELPESVFVDRCMDMRHNGGWALDKYYRTYVRIEPSRSQVFISQTNPASADMRERLRCGELDLNDFLTYKRSQDIKAFYRPERLFPVSPETEELLRDDFAGKDSVRYMRRLLNDF